MKSKRTKALEVSEEVKRIVMARDGNRCIVCHTPNNLTYAHYINRGKGGLGVEQNIVIMCMQHHFDLDQTNKRKNYLGYVAGYLKSKYKDWDESKLFYGGQNGLSK